MTSCAASNRPGRKDLLSPWTIKVVCVIHFVTTCIITVVIASADVEILAYAGSPKALHRSSPPAITATNAITTIPEEGREEEGEGEGDSSSATSDDGSASSDSAGPVSSRFKERKWPTPWHWQFLVLTLRTFRQSRHFILSKLSLIQNIILSVICSLVWFQLPDTEESITDRVGFVSPHYSKSLDILCH